MSTAATIDIQNASKTYRGGIHALKGVNLRVEPGEIFGLLGPNGAGKSTLVKIIMTIISPSSVTGTVLGEKVGHKPTLARIGYLPEHHKFPDYLTASQTLDFFGALSRVDRRTRKKRIAELLPMVGLANVGKRKVRQFSKGMRQRLGLAQALINDPQLLLLDEPTDGVDPEGRRDIRLMLEELRRRGKSVLVNSHILAELEQLIDRAAIISHGQLKAEGSIEQLTSYSRFFAITAMPPSTLPPQGLPFAKPTLPELPIAESLLTSEHNAQSGEVLLKLSVPQLADIQPVIDRLRANHWLIARVTLSRPTLEDAFIRAVMPPGQTSTPIL